MNMIMQQQIQQINYAGLFYLKILILKSVN